MFKRFLCWLNGHSLYLSRGADYTNIAQYECKSCHKKIKFHEFWF